MERIIRTSLTLRAHVEHYLVFLIHWIYLLRFKTSLLQKVQVDIVTTEEVACDVVEKILQDLETTIETLQKIKKKFKYFHSKNFSF